MHYRVPWIYIETMVLCVCISKKSKRPIQTVEHDFHIEISLEIKFYSFLNFFLLFLDR
jgi:hypothetical protein